MPESTRERQYRQTLCYSGQAFIIFGIWSIVKLMLQAYLNPIDWADMEALNDLPAHTLQTATYFIVIFFMTADILIRLYIGLSALKESKGQRRRIAYLFAAALYVIFTVISLFPSVYDTNYENKISFVTLFFDVTNIITLVIIIADSWKLRKLTR